MKNKTKILLLDDDDPLRLNLKLFLEDEGFLCKDYASGEEALKGIKENEFQLAVVDIRLPGMNGEDFIKSAAAYDSSLKYLIHTGNAGYNVPDDMEALGIKNDQVYSKPVQNLSLLADKIKEMI